MNYFGRLWSGFRAYYQEINPATLTGAIDVIVVEQPDGSYICSPFHVRFGKLGLLRAKEKVVDISINDEVVPGIHMKLGDSGEAFFVEDVPDDDPEVPIHLCTSPLPTDEEIRMKKGLADLRQLQRNLRRSECHESTAEPPSKERLGDREAAAASLFRSAISNPDFTTTEGFADSFEESGESLSRAADSNASTSAASNPEKPSFRIFLPSDQSESGPCFDSCDEQRRREKVLPRRKRMRHKMREIPIEKRRGGAQKSAPRKTFSWHSGLASMGTIPGVKVGQPPPQPPPLLPKELPLKRESGSSTGTDGGPTAKAGDDIFQLDVSEEDETTPTVERFGTSLITSSPLEKYALEVHQDDSEDLSSTKCSTGGSSGYLSVSLPTGVLFPRRSLPLTSVTTSATTPGAQQEGYAGNTTPEGKTTVIFSINEEKGGSGLTVPNVEYPYSDTELTPTGNRKILQTKSDTDLTMVDKRWPQPDNSTEQGEWNWGELPTPSKEAKGFDRDGPIAEIDEYAKTDPNKLESSGGWITSWFMGKPRREEPEDGVYLDDLVNDPEKAAKYLSSSLEEKKLHMPKALDVSSMDDDTRVSSSGGVGRSTPALSEPLLAGPSGAQQERNVETMPCSTRASDDGGYISEPNSITAEDMARSIEDLLSDIALSLCGNLTTPIGTVSQELFDQHLVSFDQLNAQPTLISSHDLVIKVGNKYERCNESDLGQLLEQGSKLWLVGFRFYNWKVAAPILVSLLVFQQPLSESAIESLVRQHSEPGMDLLKHTEEKAKPDQAASAGGYSSWFSWKRGGSEEPQVSTKELGTGPAQGRSKTPVPTPTPPATLTAAGPPDSGSPSRFLFGADDHIFYASSDNESDAGGVKRYRKSLRLSSDQLKGLNLKSGQNRARFSVTTKYQGTTWCTCDIYLWKWSDSLVVSDIDGTITKSDVMGQIAPYVGGMWAQPGVTKLFTHIYNNGYRIVYLSARAIGQSYATKEYLRSVRLSDLPLPEGPVFLSPTSLLAAFHREVIEKKPEEFKKACLNDLRSLFPAIRNPLYAGFGNKINDTWAYRALGIPTSRIFSINHLGELRHEFSQGFSSSYESLAFDMVDHIFPPLHSEEESQRSNPEQFSAFTFWKAPHIEIQIEE